MGKEEYYIINPNYVLINDIHRVIITNESDKYQNDTIRFDKKFESFIHPLQAQMLSFFDGEHTLQEIIQSISVYFELREEDVETILKQYIENEKKVFLSYQNNVAIFPENIVVQKQNIARYHKYRVEDFYLDSQLDFRSRRYYVPRYFLFVLNMDCYTNCSYCYADKKHVVPHSLSTQRILAIIDEIQNLGGAVSIDCNGGEILMHPDIFTILKRLTDAGYYPLISTKLPLSKDQVKLIKASGIHDIQLSLDTSDKVSLNKILRIKKDDYYDRMLNSIIWMREQGLDVRIHSVITSQNADIDSFEKMMKDTIERGVHKIVLTPAGYSLFKSCQEFGAIKPQVNQLNQLYELTSKYQEAFPDKEITLESPGFLKNDYQDLERCQEMFKERLHCSGNKSSMVILPDGKVTVCEEMYWHPQFILGDLTTQSVMDVWSSAKAQKLYHFSQEDISEKSACKKCQTFNDCRGEGKAICWKYIQYFYGRDNWDFPYPSCEQAPKPYQDCLI